MTLDTASTLNFGWHGTLSAPLNLDMATYLRYFDLPVPGAHLERLGVMARVVIGTLLNQPTRPWGLVTELAATFETSRETLYEIAARLRAGVLVRPIEKDAAHLHDARLAEWVQADDEAERLVNLSAEVRRWRGHLCDALELVDWRSGEIRDRAINEWLLNEVIGGLRQLVKYLEGQQAEMLTFLDWLEINLAPWPRRLALLLPEPVARQSFQATVARAWRLNRAVANGHTSFRHEAEFANEGLVAWVADDPVARQLAEALLNILEGVVRTSCAAETINSILRPYLTVKRSFHSRETAQAWLNLFCLWFNRPPLNRSQRRQGEQPMSPYQYAGVKVYTDDGRETLETVS